MSLSNNPYHFSACMRADLAGGTLDIWPLYLILGNCITVQFSLPFYTQIHLILHSNKQDVTVRVQDDVFQEKSLKDFLSLKERKLTLIQTILQYVKPNQGFELICHSDSPIGGGIGASSSLCVCLLRCFQKALQLKIPSVLHLCRDLEAQTLKTCTGIQDYIIPLQTVSQLSPLSQEEREVFQIKDLLKRKSIQNHSKEFLIDEDASENVDLAFRKKNHNIFSSPFLNIIHLNPVEPYVETLSLPESMLKNHLILVDTAISHQSGVNNWDMVQQALENPSLFEECRDIALDMADSCRKGDFDRWPLLFEKEYAFRQKLHGYVHQEIEVIKKYIVKEGARAIKVMGAGGGGLLLVWADDKKKVIQACHNKKLRIFNV